MSSFADNPLPSWRDGATRRTLLGFVDRVTRAGSADFVPVAERVAVFDHDGTLWPEQPMYVQMRFLLNYLTGKDLVMAKEDGPTGLLHHLLGELGDLADRAQRARADLMRTVRVGLTTEEYEASVLAWMGSARHPRFDRLYPDLAYQPMLELLAYLAAHGFVTYIVSAGEADFLRPWAQSVYGVPPERILGSRLELKFETRDGRPALIREPELDRLTDGPQKPIVIYEAVGRRPILAVGNSEGDRAMFDWTLAGAGPRLAVLVHHTDAEREWAYDQHGLFGRLSETLAAARARGWPVVDMREDWQTMYRFEAAT